jgi:hypothetical protein
MTRVWRFIVSWRYLLLICIVLIGAGEYLMVGIPHVALTSATRSSSFPIQYEKIEQGMTQSQIVEILGPPQYRDEQVLQDLKTLEWSDDQQVLIIYFLWGNPTSVIQKHLTTRSDLHQNP